MRGAEAVKLARVQADLDALAEFRDPDRPGWTRPVFSEPYVRSRDWVAERMRDAGLRVRRDEAGNLIGAMGEPNGPPLATGSHTDSVSGGGRFDGPVGLLSAIEAARCIRESGRKLAHELRVVDFIGEEPNEFGISCVGSRAIAGTLTAEHLGLRDPQGRSLAEALTTVGGQPSSIHQAAWKDGLSAFVELHIEQGPVLERAGAPVGIVSGIAGIERVQMSFVGQADHAGTTPMGARRDALCTAAEAILAVEQIAAEGKGVGTAGRIEAHPGALNVIPDRVELWAELRHTSSEWLQSRLLQLETAVYEAARKREVKVTVTTISRTDPVIASSLVTSAMSTALEELGIESITLPSGAGHDTVQMARLGPVGMLFVPSKDGRSHCPEEWTSPNQIEAGVRALLATLLVLDGQ